MQEKNKGQLCIFFSCAEGMGETRAMLRSAQSQQEKGRRVVIAALASPIEQGTAALSEGFPHLPPQMSAGRPELDLDRVLTEKPDLVIIDRLAHTNPEGFRHRRRYQDVQELLLHGIDVYTTAQVSSKQISAI